MDCVRPLEMMPVVMALTQRHNVVAMILLLMKNKEEEENYEDCFLFKLLHVRFKGFGYRVAYDWILVEVI